MFQNFLVLLAPIPVSVAEIRAKVKFVGFVYKFIEKQVYARVSMDLTT